MSSNDPNEYLKFLIQQQQQAQRQQAQGGAAVRHQPGAVPSADLGNLVAGYLRASSASTSGNGTTATGPSPFASLMSSASSPAPNNVDSVQQQQQQLLASAKLLSSVNISAAGSPTAAGDSTAFASAWDSGKASKLLASNSISWLCFISLLTLLSSLHSISSH